MYLTVHACGYVPFSLSLSLPTSPSSGYEGKLVLLCRLHIAVVGTREALRGSLALAERSRRFGFVLSSSLAGWHGQGVHDEKRAIFLLGCSVMCESSEDVLSGAKVLTYEQGPGNR